MTDPTSTTPPGSGPIDAEVIASAARVVSGPVRVGRRTKDLIKELRPGDIAVIDHCDLDRVAGEGLVASGVAAVVNASPSVSGRYPNSGPLRLAQAGILLVDVDDGDVMTALADGQQLVIDGGRLVADGAIVAHGRQLDQQDVEALMEQARDSIGNELERFAVNTLEYVEKEARLLFEPIDVPELRDRVRRASRPDRRARSRLPGGSQGAAALHRRVPPGARRGRRGRRCVARHAAHPRHDHRGLRLAVRTRLELRRRARPPRPPRRSGSRDARNCSSTVWTTTSSSSRAPARTLRCCSPTSAEPS